MSKLQTANNNKIEQFSSLVLEGINAWVKAGELVAREMEINPGFADDIVAAHPEISIDVVYAFKRIGDKALDPRLLLNDSPGFRKLRQLSFNDQQKYIERPVEVLVRDDKSWTTLNVDVANLTPDQVRQVFNGDKVRTVGAQRAWVESAAVKRSVPTADPGRPYRVTGKQLIILEPCRMTARDVVAVLAEMQS